MRYLRSFEGGEKQKMNTDIKVSAAELKAAEDYLKSYRMNGKLLRLEKYEKEYFDRDDPCEYEAFGEIPLARARMYEIRHLINSLDNCDEKLLLYYHYIKGEPAERCGYLLGVSRSTAFRMKKRGIAMVALALSEKRR